MRSVLALLIVLSFAVATVTVAGVPPMGGVGHGQAMATEGHAGHHHAGHRHDAPSDAAECPPSIIACAGVGIAAVGYGAGLRLPARSRPWPLSAINATSHKPDLEAPPPKT
jgi:hypothetical protein